MRAAPDYADAMFNLALVLQRNNKHAEAAEYWRRYLANDTQSEWAARARRLLRNANPYFQLLTFTLADDDIKPRFPFRRNCRLVLKCSLSLVRQTTISCIV
jgi:hypothetical protein